MVLTPESFAFNCGCGREHKVLLQKAVIEPGALYQLDALRAELGYGGRATAVYDKNTYTATQGRHPKAEQEVILDPQGLHADEHGTGALLAQIEAAPPEVLLAVGSGTVHDITRYCARKLGIPFISAPTAASVDGFVSTVAAMTWHGFKKTMPGVSPPLLVADLDIIAAAPAFLGRSGLGDIIGKYVSLADWSIAHALVDEYYCEGIANLTKQAVDEAVAAHHKLPSGDLDAYASLTKALVLSGVAMQLADNSRPASGAEHHISHLIEIGVPWIGQNDALHGEKVGIGALLAADEYHRWAQLSANEIQRRIPAGGVDFSAPLTQAELTPIFGPALAPEVLLENQPICTTALRASALYSKWDQLQQHMSAIPTAAQIADILEATGAKRSLADVGVDEGLRERLLLHAPLVRNRLTFMRVRRYLVQ